MKIDFCVSDDIGDGLLGVVGRHGPSRVRVAQYVEYGDGERHVAVEMGKAAIREWFETSLSAKAEFARRAHDQEASA